jgi:hypothetical protein
MALAGCAQGAQRVAVDILASDLVFGAYKPKTPQPSNPLNPGEAPLAQGDLLLGLPSFDFTRFRPGPSRLRPVTCPTASDSAIAEFPAGLSSHSLAPVGAFRWVSLFAVFGQAGKVVSQTFPERYVLHTQRLPDDHVDVKGQSPISGNHVVESRTYDVIQDYVVNNKVVGQMTQSWLVRQPDNFYDSTDPKGQGLILTKIQYKDPAGKDLRPPFAPLPGQQLLVYPLPVQNGSGGSQAADTSAGHNTFASSSNDPTTGEQYSLKITIGNKVERVDACGDVLYGWPADALVTYSSGTLSLPPVSKTYNYHYVVATQYGSLLVHEDIKVANPDTTPASEDDEHMGQLHPDPLPSNLQ